ncbi:MAG: pyridoxamine 5'-phosphate oxidase family protein [Chloroflexaceae bacterium]|nr:pyridoxamine 5'-phosphate oxidase family protein [Chloroflexaceae bacterium]
MQTEDRAALRELITTHRQAALGTVDDGAPFVSMVLYALEWRAGAGPAFIIHVSGLSAHTRHMRADPRVSLLVMQPDVGADDPQALARVTIQCQAVPLATDDPTYPAARAAYLTRLPRQEYLFGFPDFTLFRLEPRSARFIGGFARAFSLTADQLAEVLGTGS